MTARSTERRPGSDRGRPRRSGGACAPGSPSWRPREAEHAQRSARVQDAPFADRRGRQRRRDLPAFYATIHGIVGELMYARNFYIALYDDERQAINFPYYVDTVDTDIPDPAVWEPFGDGRRPRRSRPTSCGPGDPCCWIRSACSEPRWPRGEIEQVGASARRRLARRPALAEGRTLGADRGPDLRRPSIATPRPTSTSSPSSASTSASALSRVRADRGDPPAQRRARARQRDRPRARRASSTSTRSSSSSASASATIFDAGRMFIGLYDEATDSITFPYDIDEGERVRPRGIQLGPG